MYAVGLYLAIYLSLLIAASIGGFVHLFDYQYYSVQFWLFYNLILSIVLFGQMYRFYRTSRMANTPAFT